MAQVVKGGHAYFTGPRAITKRPELAALLGAVAAEWSVVETRVMSLCAILMGARMYRAPSGPDDVLLYDTLAEIVFEEVHSLHAKLNLAERLSDEIIDENDPGLLEEIKKALSRVRADANTHRNRLLHARWGISEDFPDALVLLPFVMGRQKLLYGESDFNESLERIIDTGHAVAKVEVKVQKFLKGE